MQRAGGRAWGGVFVASIAALGVAACHSSVSQPAPLDGSCDCTPFDAGTDTSAGDANDATVSDASAPESGAGDGGGDAPCALSDGAGADAGPPAGGVLWSPSGLVEQPAPWQANSCTAWSQVPPAYDYQALAVSSDGLWASADASYPPATFLAHLGPCGWTLTYFPTYGGSLAAGPDWVTIAGSSPNHVGYRQNGTWYDVYENALGAPAVAANVANSLVLGTDNGVYVYDRTTGWTSILQVSGADQGALHFAGTLNGLYEVYGPAGISYSLRYWDGTTWASVPRQENADVPLLVASSPTETIAISGRLYLANGATLTALPDVPCADTVTYENIAGGPNGVVVEASCGPADGGVAPDGAGAARNLYRRQGTGWSVISTTLPTPALLAVDTNTVSTIFTSEPAGVIASVDQAGWKDLRTVQTPPWTYFAGNSALGTYVAGNGVAQLSSNGLSWQPIAGSQVIQSASGAWLASDGTLFVSTLANGTATLWHYAGGIWTNELSVSASTMTNIIGRSSTDAFVGIGVNLWHWDGATWSNLTAAPCTADPGYVPSLQGIAVAGAQYVEALCLVYGAGPVILEWNGTAWTDETSMLSTRLAVFLTTVGPDSSPQAFVLSNYTYIYERSSTGWVSVAFPGLGSGPTSSGATIRRFAAAPGSLYVSLVHAPDDVLGHSSADLPFTYEDLTLFTDDVNEGLLPTLWAGGSWLAEQHYLGTPGNPGAVNPRNTLVLCEPGP